MKPLRLVFCFSKTTGLGRVQERGKRTWALKLVARNTKSFLFALTWSYQCVFRCNSSVPHIIVCIFCGIIAEKNVIPYKQLNEALRKCHQC